MLTADFLTAIWPSQGYYCLANPRSDGDRKWWQHESYASINEACDRALALGQQYDTYFTVLSLHEPFIIDQSKIDKAIEAGRKVTAKTGRSYRVHRNMAWARSFFVDLDVGKDDGYPTQAVAFAALKEFIRASGLPRPWIVQSGVGLHIYWPLDADISVEDWRPFAIKLKRICEHYGLKADPVRTADVASVLRVPGTLHLKDRANPKPVRVERDGPISSFDSWCKAIDRAYMLTPTGEMHDGDMPVSMQSAPVALEKLKRACGLATSLIDKPEAANEPKWYKLLGVLKFVENGPTACHDVSKVHPHYEPEWIDKKLEQLDRAMPDGSRMGPTTCRAFAETCGPEHCKTCWFARTTFYKDGQSSPIVAARRLPLDTVLGVPPPPAPYLRTSGGILKEGTEAPEIVCPFDLYPIANIENQQSETRSRSSTWVIQLPRKPARTFLIENLVANDMRELSKYLAQNAFLPHFDEVKGIKLYMTAYLRELQRYCDDQQQYARFGWTADQKGFVFNDNEYRDGKLVPALLNGRAQKVGEPFIKRGSRDVQVKSLNFYSHPTYVGHQFMIAAALAAPLFMMTDQFGTVVNMTGPSGASKSTALTCAAAMWGRPDLYMMTGTANGSTIKARNAKIATLCNLPILVDEITTMSADDLKEMVMGFSQPSPEPERLTQTAEFRQKVADMKSTLMLTTSNNSIHEMLAYRNTAGTAGSMRLFEIATEVPLTTTKNDADQFLITTRANCGWIGPEWLTWVTGHLDEVWAGVRAEQVRLDKLCDMQAAERFWSAVAAVTIHTMKLAHRLGLLPFDPQVAENWLVNKQLAHMRGAIVSSYATNLDILLAYLASAANQMALMMTVQGNKTHLEKGPSGELAGGLRTSDGTAILYLSHMRAYASKERIQLNGLLSDLEQKGLVTRRRTDPVAGTIYSTGSQPCVVIDLNHPSIRGHERVDQVGKIVALRRG